MILLQVICISLLLLCLVATGYKRSLFGFLGIFFAFVTWQSCLGLPKRLIQVDGKILCFHQELPNIEIVVGGRNGDVFEVVPWSSKKEHSLEIYQQLKAQNNAASVYYEKGNFKVINSGPVKPQQ